MTQGKIGSMGPSRVGGGLMTNFGAHSHINVPSMQNGLVGFEGLLERGRNPGVGNSGGQEDSRMRYQLDLEKITTGKDAQTTVMIKNIPNKYTSNMLLAVIDETHEGTYDFFYLPIDFKNKCNVGYAFINMSSPAYVVSFYQAFAGRKWEKFKSGKIVTLAYARIQGKVALINHFQNSSLMSEDKRCHPMLFDPRHTENDNQIVLNGLLEEHNLHENPMKDNFIKICGIVGIPGSFYEGG